MVSSVVGFYSSPLFTSLMPRAQDTNLTQVCDSQHVYITVGYSSFALINDKEGLQILTFKKVVLAFVDLFSLKMTEEKMII